MRQIRQQHRYLRADPAQDCDKADWDKHSTRQVHDEARRFHDEPVCVCAEPVHLCEDPLRDRAFPALPKQRSNPLGSLLQTRPTAGATTYLTAEVCEADFENELLAL